MFRIAPIAVLAFLTVAPAVAADRPDPCTVTPDPVVLGVDTSYTVTATGAVPAEFYEVTLPDPGGTGHRNSDESRVWLGQADATGTVTATVEASDGRVTGDGYPYSLWPGEATLRVVRYRTGGGPGGAASLLATCSFTVQ